MSYVDHVDMLFMKTTEPFTQQSWKIYTFYMKIGTIEDNC